MHILSTHLVHKLFYFFDRKRHFQYKVFVTILYLWVIGNTLLLLPGHEHFWGDFDRFIPRRDLADLSYFEKSQNLLFLPIFENEYFVFIALQIIFSVLVILNIYPKLFSIFVWFLTINLDNKIYVTTDGGNNLIHLLLFYSIFFINSQSPKTGMLIRYIGVTAFIVCRFQICLVYFMAGLVKITGDFWTAGTGLYYALTVDEYTHPTLSSLVMSYPAVTVVCSYLTLLFQLSFPFLIWMRNLRPIYFVIGSFIHLGISFGMGLLSFGLAMVVAYSAFYTQAQASNIVKTFTVLLLYLRAGFCRAILQPMNQQKT